MHPPHRTLTGIPDHTVQAQLATTIMLSRYSPDSDVITEPIGTPLPGAIASATGTRDTLVFSCLVLPAGGQRFQDSLIGLGKRPLPLTQ